MGKSIEASRQSGKLQTVVNCEASISGRFSVKQTDVSQFHEGAPDNDFQCPHTGEYVALAWHEQDGDIECLSPACRYIKIG